MAIIKRNILGTFQGSISDIILRVRNGKLVAYTKPSKQKVSKSKSALSARYKFSLAVALAKEINNNKTLSQIWAEAKIKATNSYQKLIKVNSSLTEPVSLSLSNKITPDSIPLTDVQIKLNNNFLELMVSLEKLNKELLKSNKLFCLVHFWNQNNDNKKTLSKPDYVMKLFNFDLSELDKNSILNFLIDIEDLIKLGFGNGLALVALTGIKNSKLFWSSTFGKKFI